MLASNIGSVLIYMVNVSNSISGTAFFFDIK